jgi:cellulose synthase (UDP-forming)
MHTQSIGLEEAKNKFLQTKVSKTLILFAALLTVIYFFLITFQFVVSNPFLFGVLIAGEVFHVFQILMLLFTIWDTEPAPLRKNEFFNRPVDVYITVAGEPIDIVEETVKSALAMDYPDFKVHILNDGYVAKKDNWQEVEGLALQYGINCITRKIPGGAKAGNINHALRTTNNPYIVIFDADHVPHKDFLRKTMPYFADPAVGYVQSPQFYKNYDLNYVTKSAWEQQELFFGPICKGKNRLNSVTMCGTNMVIAREALISVGGMSEDSIAEDFLTGLLIHEKGMKSVYVPEVLAEGLAPEDFLSYSKQQFRWARGGLDIIFKYNLLFRTKGLSFVQRLQYLSSASFYLSGIVVVIDALIPVIFFYTGAIPIQTSTMLLATVFLPYMFLTLYILQKSTNFSFTFSSLAFSMAGFNIHLKAIWAAVTHQKSQFQITPKRQVSGNFINLVIPHMVYIVLVVVGIVVAYERSGMTASLITPRGRFSMLGCSCHSFWLHYQKKNRALLFFRCRRWLKILTLTCATGLP